MNQTGLLVVGNEPIESIYTLKSNGLYLPPYVTPVPQKWVQNHLYPEFAAGLVAEFDKMKTTSGVISKQLIKSYSTSIYSPHIFSKPKSTSLEDIVPGMHEDFALNCPFPQCDMVNTNVANAIVHLNDDHRWPREKIANWLDTLTVDLTVRKVA